MNDPQAPARAAAEHGHRAAVLLSVNVGMPRNVAWQGKTVYTGVWKHRVTGPLMVRRLNIDGDGQGDPNGHGGEHRNPAAPFGGNALTAAPVLVMAPEHARQCDGGHHQS